MGGLRFLPWVRDGVARVVADTDPLTGALPRARATVDLSVTALGTDTATAATREITGTSTALLHGPGDVVGVDPQEVIRSHPAPGAENVEVSEFAAVEFDRPDLPWLYTPARPDADGRLRPWLVLVVVPVAAGGELRTEPGQALPRLATTVRQLPGLADSWAWAHAQVLVTSEDEDVAAVLADAPERTLSRLLCPRRLATGTDYLAAVVPAFEAGVRAGLGEPVDDAGPLAPAWGPGSAHPAPDDPLLLPVYHHWTFRTGPDGDFESLARRLQARPLPNDVGRQPVDIAAPGGGLPAQPDEGVEGRSVLGFEGALAAPGMTPTAWADDVRAAWRDRLTGLLRHAADRLTPPRYGDLHSQQTQLPAPDAEPRWLAGLNLDPRYRAAAALGTQVVQRHQEDLAAAAWQRAAQIREANEQLRRGQAARDTATALYARRVDPHAPGAAVGDDRLVALTQPVHDLVEVPTPGLAAGPGDPLDQRLAGNPGAQAATSAPVRRLLRPRGPLARRVAGDVATATLARLADGGSAVPPARVPTGGAVLDALAGDGRGVGDLTREVIERAAADPWWHTGTSGLTARTAGPALAADDPVTRVATNGGDLLGADRFFLGAADGRLFERRRVAPDRWVWRDHGTPPGTAVATSGAAVTPDRVYVRTHDSRLFERRWDGDRWVWTDCGAPTGGLHSRPVAAGPALYALGGDAGLWRFDPAARSWTPLGSPVGGGERLWGSPRPSMLGVLVATSANRLFGHDGSQWRAYGGPPVWGSPAAEHAYPNRQYGIEYVTPAGQLVSLFRDGSTYPHDPVPDGLRIISLAQDAAPLGNDEELAIMVLAQHPANPADVRLMRRYLWYHDVQERYLWAWGQEAAAPGVGAHRPGPFVGDSREGEIFAVTADGRLTAYRWGYSGAAGWVDHGAPADPRGAGPVDAPAPAHVRFAPKVGLLSSLVFGHTVAQGTGSRAHLQVAHHLGEDGVVREPALTAPVDGPAIPAVARATATTLGTVLPTGRPTLVTAALLPGTTAGTCRIAYWVGRDADGTGAAGSGWTGPYELPDPVSADAAGLDVALADLDGDGRPELVVAYAVSRSGGTDNRVFYRVGWGLDDTGAVTDGWTDSQPTPMQLGSFGAVGVEVVDMTGDHVPDLLVFAAGSLNGTPVARYLTGRGLNRRGRVAGGWTAARAVPDETATATGDGAGVAVADITGTRRPDLVVARRSGGTVSYRVAFDLDPDGVPVDWSPPVTLTGAADAGTARGCPVTVADLRADLVADRARMGDDFMAAAAAHQGRLAPAQALARDHHPTPVDVATAAAAVRETVRPETAVTGEVLAGIDLGDGGLVDALPDSGDPLRRLLAGVTFDVPTYELLRGLSQEHVVPNLPAVAPETMTALAANPRFIEAFLVGLNHEMSREMLWREFPADPRQTWFRQFWDVRGAASAGEPLTDIPPLTDPAWRSGPLGSHLTAVGAPGEQSLVLVIRGELLRRYPSTVVTMRAASWTGPRERTPTGPDVLPIFNAWLSPDLLLFGFPSTAEVARGADSRDTGPAGSFFLLREQPAAPRFGVDLTGDPPPPDAVVFAARPGRNAADTARAVLQRPVLLARHASDLLPPPETQP